MKFIFIVITFTLLLNISITLQTNTESHRKKYKVHKNNSKGDAPIAPTVPSSSSLPNVQPGTPSNNNNSQSNSNNNFSNNNTNNNQDFNNNNNGNNNNLGRNVNEKDQGSSRSYADIFHNNQEYNVKMQEEIKNHVFKFKVNGNQLSCKGQECMQYIQQYPWLKNVLKLRNNLQKYNYDGNKFSRNSAYSNRHINYMKKKINKKKRKNNRN